MFHNIDIDVNADVDKLMMMLFKLMLTNDHIDDDFDQVDDDVNHVDDDDVDKDHVEGVGGRRHTTRGDRGEAETSLQQL